MRVAGFKILLLLPLLLAAAFNSTSATNAFDTAVTVIADGKSDWRIVVPPPGSAGGTWAGTELKKYLREITGCRLETVKRTVSKPAIVIGFRNELTPADRALLPPAPKGYDGYTIVIHPGSRTTQARIVIAGENGRGLVYGVYDLLERAGCRWFYPSQDPADPEVIPRKKTIGFRTGTWSKASDLRFRICNPSEWGFEMKPEPARKQLDWAMKNRYNAIGWQCDPRTPLDRQYQWLDEHGLLRELHTREMLLHGPGRCFNLLLPGDEMKTHPEWFGVRNGKRVPQTVLGAQFCWSNPEARRRLIGNVEGFFRGAPELSILFLAPFEGGPACECETCQAEGPSNLLMLLMKEVIETLKPVKPNVLVETVGGSGPSSDPPRGDTLHPEERVIWAHSDRVLTCGFDSPHYDRKEDLERWCDMARGRLTVCQYYCDSFSGPPVLSPFSVALEGDRRFLARDQIDSVCVVMRPRGCWWNYGLNGFLAGRCLYDPSLPPQKVLLDYCLQYFGTNAGTLLAFYYDDWARNPELCYRTQGNSRESDRAALARQRRNWLAPALSSVAHDSVLKHRVSKVERLHTLAERLMEIHRQREQIRVLRKAGEFEIAGAMLQKTRDHTDDVLKLVHEMADSGQGLIDRAEMPTVITADVKGWLDEEAKGIATQRRE